MTGGLRANVSFYGEDCKIAGRKKDDSNKKALFSLITVFYNFKRIVHGLIFREIAGGA